MNTQKKNTIRIKRVSKVEKRILKNLFSYFMHDLSPYEDIELDKHGFFNCPDIKLIIENKGLKPFLIFHKKEIAGFINISMPVFAADKTTHVIQQLFVLKKFRRLGVGKEASKLVLNKFPGKYAIGQLIKNKPAVKFWKSFLKELNIPYESEKRKDAEGNIILYQHFDWNKNGKR